MRMIALILEYRLRSVLPRGRLARARKVGLRT